MSDTEDKHRSSVASSVSSEATSREWVDTERPEGIVGEETISETVSTSQMKPTDVAEDIIGYVSAYMDPTRTGAAAAAAGQAQHVSYNHVTQTSYQSSTGPLTSPTAAVAETAENVVATGAHGAINPRSLIGGTESAFTSVTQGPAAGIQGGYSQSSVTHSAVTSATTTTGVHAAECGSVVTGTLPIVAPGAQKEVDCCKYELNRDPNPIVVVKQPEKPIHYDQNIGVRYLKPPTPPAPGPIIVREVRPPPLPEAPPLHVKLRPERPKTPPPLIIREAPPVPPAPLPTQVINKVLPPAPPPPRKVIVEKLPPLPPKPRQVIIEKWLPYEQIKRKIIYQRLPDLPPTEQVKNTLITWSPFKADVTRRYHNLGIVRADPAAYSAQHAHQMLDSQSTMNAMAQLGAGLHYHSAAGAHSSSSNVYVEDRTELNRLMHTNFHPNEPVCKQFVAGQVGGGAHYGMMPCPPPTVEESQLVLQEARQMAAMYGAQHGSGQIVGPCQPICPETPWMASAYGIPCEMLTGQTYCQEVLSMYPQYCEDAEFVPPPMGPFM